MNYLSHYIYNHEICGIPARPWFVLGVALPDLWPRFSRRRRIRWPVLRAYQPEHLQERELRAGLLNHIFADRHFHVLPCFVKWQAELKSAFAGRPLAAETSPLVLDFLIHVSIELALDHHLVRADPELPGSFYAALGQCEGAQLESRISTMGAVDATGLAAVRDLFIRRGFLNHYDRIGALTAVLRRVLEMTTVRETPPPAVFEQIIEAAVAVAAPAQVWRELQPAWRPTPDDLAPHNQPSRPQRT